MTPEATAARVFHVWPRVRATRLSAYTAVPDRLSTPLAIRALESAKNPETKKTAAIAQFSRRTIQRVRRYSPPLLSLLGLIPCTPRALPGQGTLHRKTATTRVGNKAVRN